MTTWRKGIRNTIKKSGSQIIGVFSEDAPTFTYTIGLSERHGFELICVGVSSQIAAGLFNAVARYLKVPDRKLDLDVPDARWTNIKVMFKECEDALVREYAIQAFAYYDSPIKFVQLVVADPENRLPGEPDFDEAYMGQVQPLLYRAKVVS